MDSEKPKFDWRRSLITAGIVLLAALVVGGTTWYVMDKSSKEIKTADEASVSTLQKQVDALEATAAEKAATPATTKTTEVAPAVTTGLSTLEAYCKTANNGVLLTGYSYMKTANGEFANCGIGDSVSAGGAMLIAKFESGAWVKLWSGNGVIDTSICDANKIPNKMSGGTCAY